MVTRGVKKENHVVKLKQWKDSTHGTQASQTTQGIHGSKSQKVKVQKITLSFLIDNSNSNNNNDNKNCLKGRRNHELLTNFFFLGG